MSSGFATQKAQDDFNKARTQATLSRIVNLLTPQNEELLSLQEVRNVLRPKSETYRGLKTVPISRIVGSEGRYRDFNKSFLPKRDTLRPRWVRVDEAHYRDIILPAIQLYEIGGVYFVRDGNHRVSVARAQGVESIDAEVTSLSSEIELDTDLTKERLMELVIDYEKRKFYERTKWPEIIPEYDLRFTAPGRYDVVEHHIHVHKYFINQDRNEEIPFEEAMRSWYDNVFRPIIEIIHAARVLGRFPGRTPADLYVWIVKHWHELKVKYGPGVAMEQAAVDFSHRFGLSFGQRVRRLLRRVFPRSKSIRAT